MRGRAAASSAVCVQQAGGLPLRAGQPGRQLDSQAGHLLHQGVLLRRDDPQYRTAQVRLSSRGPAGAEYGSVLNQLFTHQQGDTAGDWPVYRAQSGWSVLSIPSRCTVHQVLGPDGERAAPVGAELPQPGHAAGRGRRAAIRAGRRGLPSPSRTVALLSPAEWPGVHCTALCWTF